MVLFLVLFFVYLLSLKRLLEAIRTSNDEGLRPSTSHPPLYIFDARPKMNALGNQAAGAGFELTGTGLFFMFLFCFIYVIY